MSVKTVATAALTLLAIGALALVVVNARVSLAISAAAAVLAIAIDHAVGKLQRLRLQRGLAILLVVLALLSALVGIGFLLVPPAVEQVRALVGSAPEYFRALREGKLYPLLNRHLELDRQIEQFLTALPSHVGQALKVISSLLAAVGTGLTVLMLAIFMLAFARPLLDALLAEVIPSHRERYARVFGNIYRSIGGYVGGLAIVVSVNAAVTTAFLAIIRVPYFLPLGLLSGLSSLLPLVGNTLAGILISLVALAAVGLWPAVGVAAFFVVYQQFENQLLGPMVYRQTVHLNPLVGLLAVLVFSELAGILGALASVPMVAVGQVILHELLAFRHERLGWPPPGGPAPGAPQPEPGPDAPATGSAKHGEQAPR